MRKYAIPVLVVTTAFLIAATASVLASDNPDEKEREAADLSAPRPESLSDQELSELAAVARDAPALDKCPAIVASSEPWYNADSSSLLGARIQLRLQDCVDLAATWPMTVPAEYLEKGDDYRTTAVEFTAQAVSTVDVLVLRGASDVLAINLGEATGVEGPSPMDLLGPPPSTGDEEPGHD